MKLRKFYWGKVLLTLPSGASSGEVKALIYGDSGLCINQFNPGASKGKFVAVSHVNSGTRITEGFYTHQSAKWFCEALSGLIDWNEIKADGDTSRWPNLDRDIRLMRDLVTEHKENWRKALVINKLNGGLNDASEKS